MQKLKLTPIRFLLLLGALHLCCASLSFAASKNLDASWKMGLFGANAQDTQSSSRFVGFGLDAKMKYWLQSEIFMNIDPHMSFENGSFQSIDGERKGTNGIFLSEAAAHWLFAKGSSLSAGALRQSTHHSELLLGSDQTFPAARAELQAFTVGNLKTILNFEQAIPTSNSLSTQTTGVESTPSLVSGSLAVNYETNDYYWKNRIGAFKYDNLPSAVAYQSGLRGNTVLSVTENESLFTSGYEGIEALSSFRFPVMRGWDFSTSANYLQNNKAAKSLGSAYSLGVGSEFFFLGSKSLEINLTGFRIEPDAAVASFNSAKYFNTNRNGYSLESFMNFKKHNFRIGLNYTEAEVIYLSPIQNREKSLKIMLETFYANI